MSVTIKVKGSKGTHAIEAEISVPLQTMGITEETATGHAKNIILQFATRLAKETLGSDVETFFASASSSVVASVETTETVNGSSNTRSNIPSATVESGGQNGKITVKMSNEYGECKDLNVDRSSTILDLKHFRGSYSEELAVYCDGDQLCDEMTTDEHGIGDGALLLWGDPRGGSKADRAREREKRRYRSSQEL